MVRVIMVIVRMRVIMVHVGDNGDNGKSDNKSKSSNNNSKSNGNNSKSESNGNSDNSVC